MNCDRERFEHGRLVERHDVRNRDQPCGIGQEVFARHSGTLEPHDLLFLAEIVHSVTARPAFAADDLRLDNHLLADMEAFHTLADFGDLGGYLMALGDGVGGESMGSVIDMDIRPADPDFHDLEKHLAFSGPGLRNVPEFDDAGSGHYFLQHVQFLLMLSA